MRRLKAGVRAAPMSLHPQGQPHLQRASGGDVADVQHLLPAEPALEQLAMDPVLGLLVVAGDEDRSSVSVSWCGVDHDGALTVLSAFTTRASGKAAWMRSPSGVRIAEEQRRRHALGEVERVGDVDEDLAGEVLGAGGLEGLNRMRRRGVALMTTSPCAAAAANDPGGRLSGRGRAGRRRSRLRRGRRPIAERSLALRRVARADHDAVAELEQFGGEGLRDGPEPMMPMSMSSSCSGGEPVRTTHGPTRVVPGSGRLHADSCLSPSTPRCPPWRSRPRRWGCTESSAGGGA